MGAGQPGPSTATRSNGPSLPFDAKRMAVYAATPASAVWASEIWPRNPTRTTEDSMIIPATSEVVSATSHSAVKRLDRMKTRTSPMPRPTQARSVASASGWRRWMMLPRIGRRDPRKKSTSTMARRGTSSRMPLAGSQRGHHDWSATSTMPDWNMPMRKPPATASGIEVRLPTRAAPSAGIT